ncbi:MAG TPA: N-formylglutamate amidohydrolase [Candidatus Ozemobacteraceae bacterium]|nr:N-formylglutamate amidohydrolase [Candidatus Ozemobacteraceae bacterium]
MKRFPALIIHVPHASTVIPEDVRKTFCLDDRELAEEVRLLTDHFADKLFACDPERAVTIGFPVSRLVVDPERFPDDARESMAHKGMGAVYMKTSGGKPLRHPLDPGSREALLTRYYHPHHERLTRAVDEALERRGGCLIIDGHSFPDHPLPCDADQETPRPDICLGTDPFHTPSSLVECAANYFSEAGFQVKLNRPYAGTIVPLSHHGRRSACLSLMIEINRRLYIDETNSRRSPDFSAVREHVQTVIDLLASKARIPGK